MFSKKNLPTVTFVKNFSYRKNYQKQIKNEQNKNSSCRYNFYILK